MLRFGWIHVLAVLAVALAALLLIRMHNAGGGAARSSGVAAGERLADVWCAECHSLVPAAFGRAPDFVQIANRTSTTELSLKVFLRTNHRSMPNLIVSPDQADILVQFILSLKRD